VGFVWLALLLYLRYEFHQHHDILCYGKILLVELSPDETWAGATRVVREDNIPVRITPDTNIRDIS
jgi:hypothetical protein